MFAPETIHSWTELIPVKYVYWTLSIMTAGALTTASVIGKYTMRILKKERLRLTEIDDNIKAIRDNHLTHIEEATRKTADKLDDVAKELSEQTGYLRAIAENHSHRR